MKKPTNPIRTSISEKAIVYTTDEERDVINVSPYAHDADLANLRFEDYNRVVRGGYWSVYQDYLRSARRYVYSPPAHNSYRFGFRLVLQSKK